MIVGTVRNTVKQMELQNQWQQKKEDMATFLGQKKKEAPKSAVEMQLEQMKEQAEQARENEKYAAIANKIKSGRDLSAEEIEYLRKKNPQALKDYEEIKQEEENYKRKLRGCETQEEVERLKVQEMGNCLCAAKKITANPNIPKSAKVALLEKILAKVLVVQEAHAEFVKSPEYRELPSEQEREKEKSEMRSKESEEERAEFRETQQEETKAMREETREDLLESGKEAQNFAGKTKENKGQEPTGSVQAETNRHGDVIGKGIEEITGEVEDKIKEPKATTKEVLARDVISFIDDYLKKENAGSNRVDACV